VIHGKSNEVERDWNAAGWAKVVHHVKTKYNLPIIEIGLEPCISAFIKDSINLCGKMSLLEMAEIINRAVMFIGIDSGPAHLANAVGTKGVVLLGRYRNFQRYFPYSGWYEDAENCYCVCNQYGPASNILPSSVLDAIDSMMAKSNYKTHQPCYIDERQNQHNVELLYPFNSDRILEDITTNLYQSKSENHFEEVDYYARHALRILAKMEAQYLHISKLQKKSIGTITESRDLDIDIARFIIERSIVQYKKSEFAKACSFLKIALLRLLGFAEKSAVDVTKIFDFKELERIVSEMIEKGAGNDGYKVLALAKILQSSFESALVILRGILKQNPNDQDAQKMLNLLLAMVDNFQNSVEQTNGGHTAQGKFTNELQYAEEHIQNGHYDDAEKLLCHLLSIDSNNVDILNDLAVVHQLKGNTSEAIQLLHKVLAIDERNEIALENLLFLSGKLNNIRQIQR